VRLVHDRGRDRARIRGSRPGRRPPPGEASRMSTRTFTADAVAHVDGTVRAVTRLLDELERLERWGRRLARVLGGGGRLLTAGNGGSAAHAQHLTSELVGRYRDERRPLSAIALHSETSTMT